MLKRIRVRLSRSRPLVRSPSLRRVRLRKRSTGSFSPLRMTRCLFEIPTAYAVALTVLVLRLEPVRVRLRSGCFEPEAHPVGDEARVRREKIRSIGHGSVIDDYIFDRHIECSLTIFLFYPILHIIL